LKARGGAEGGFDLEGGVRVGNQGRGCCTLEQGDGQYGVVVLLVGDGCKQALLLTCCIGVMERRQWNGDMVKFMSNGRLSSHCYYGMMKRSSLGWLVM